MEKRNYVKDWFELLERTNYHSKCPTAITISKKSEINDNEVIAYSKSVLTDVRYLYSKPNEKLELIPKIMEKIDDLDKTDKVFIILPNSSYYMKDALALAKSLKWVPGGVNVMNTSPMGISTIYDTKVTILSIEEYCTYNKIRETRNLSNSDFKYKFYNVVQIDASARGVIHIFNSDTNNIKREMYHKMTEESDGTSSCIKFSGNLESLINYIAYIEDNNYSNEKEELNEIKDDLLLLYNKKDIIVPQYSVFYTHKSFKERKKSIKYVIEPSNSDRSVFYLRIWIFDDLYNNKELEEEKGTDPFDIDEELELILRDLIVEYKNLTRNNESNYKGRSYLIDMIDKVKSNLK